MTLNDSNHGSPIAGNTETAMAEPKDYREALRAFRAVSGQTQGELEKLWGVYQGFLSRLERVAITDAALPTVKKVVAGLAARTEPEARVAAQMLRARFEGTQPATPLAASSLAKALKALREELKCSQGQLARRLGLSDTTISRWESGENASPSPAQRLTIVRKLVAMKRPAALAVAAFLGSVPVPKKGSKKASKKASKKKLSKPAKKAPVPTALAGMLIKPVTVIEEAKPQTAGELHITIKGKDVSIERTLHNRDEVAKVAELLHALF